MSDKNSLPTMLRKISAKTVCGDLKEVAPKKGEKNKSIMRVFGHARRAELVAGNDGFKDSYKFIGQFGAVNLTTGEEFRAPVMYLPEPYQSMLASEVQAREAKGDASVVTIGLDLALKYVGEKTKTGYEYVTVPVFEAEGEDPLAAIRDEAMKGVKALPAPKK